MGKLKSLIHICFLTLVGITISVYFNNIEDAIYLEDAGLQRLTRMSDYYYYEASEDYRMLCDINTFSNVILHMVDDGFEIIREVISDKRCDVLLSKGNEKYRVCYDNNRQLVSLCNRYEKSYVPLTYIIEEK